MTTKTQEQNGKAPETVDLGTIVDVNFLKAMAYDRMAGIQQLQNELQTINGRISQLAENPVPPPPLD